MQTTTSAWVAADDFAAAVREALDDLAPDDIEELTDGLEADLAERAADSDAASEPPDFGDPSSYADELRSAAGLPIRSSTRRRPLDDVLADRVRENWAEMIESIRSTPAGTALLDFTLALRPVWWVLRGWAVYQLAALFGRGYSPFEPFPTGGLQLVAFSLAVVVSVQWGRGKWLPRRWLRWTKAIVSVIAAVSLLGLIPLAFASSAAASAADGEPDTWYPQGLTRDGVAITNVFAYGADGELLDQVQLFDQDGTPLDLVGRAETENRWLSVTTDEGAERLMVPSNAVPGRTGWNVYPLREAASSDLDYSSDSDGSLRQSVIDDARAPFEDAQPLAGQDTPSDDRQPSPAPSSSPTP